MSEFHYIGGMYGKSSELNMMKEIRARGPTPVDFNSGIEFGFYSDGIFVSHIEKIVGENVELNTVFSKISHENTEKAEISDKPLFPEFEFETTTHSVLVVGWGQTEDSPPKKYWIVQNSWGSQFGENGYFYMLRGEDNGAIESTATAIYPRLPKKMV